LIPEQIEEKLSHGIHSRFCRWNCRCCFGEKLVLVLKGKTIDEDIYSSLDKYQKPKEVFYIDKFIETENGKLKERNVREHLIF
jgi:O-succinylbenzoic acid--CoA ligase